MDEIRYLGIFLVKSSKFKCSLNYAKCACYRSLNAIFGSIGRIASEEVILELISKKCIPVLLYGLEACPLSKSDKQSIDFVMNRFLMKLFKTSNMSIIKDCQEFFNFALPSVLLQARVAKFMVKFSNCGKSTCLLVEFVTLAVLLSNFNIFLFSFLLYV